MTPLFAKLNLKSERHVCVLDAPASFMPELEALKASLPDVQITHAANTPVRFALAFCTRRMQLDCTSQALIAASALEKDPVLWMCYPKGTSRNYTCDFNRDHGWDVLEAAGFEPVRMVAIDADFSALRFRRSTFVNTH